MNYKLVYTQKSAKEICKLPNDVKERIRKSLEKYADNPFLYAKRWLIQLLGLIGLE